MITLEVPAGKRKFSLDREDRLISCHRCSNIRKQQYRCSACPQTFCLKCHDKLKDELGEDCFQEGQGCPFCLGLCCCTEKSVDCKHENHCYRKCPASTRKHTSSTPNSAASTDSGKENVLGNSVFATPQADLIFYDGSESSNGQPSKRSRLESSHVEEKSSQETGYFTRSRRPKITKESPSIVNAFVEEGYSGLSSRKSGEKAISRSSMANWNRCRRTPVGSPFFSLYPTPLLKASIDDETMIAPITRVGSMSTLPPSHPSSDRSSTAPNSNFSDNEQQSTAAEFAVPKAPRRSITKPIDLKQLLDRHTLTRLQPGENPFFLPTLPFLHLDNHKQLPSVKVLLKSVRLGEQPMEFKKGPPLHLQETLRLQPPPPTPLIPQAFPVAGLTASPLLQAPYSIRNLFAHGYSQVTQQASSSEMPPPRSVGGVSDTSEESRRLSLNRFYTSPKNDQQLQMLLHGVMYSPAQQPQEQQLMANTYFPASPTRQAELSWIPTPGQLRATNVFNSPDFNWMQQQSPFVQPIPPSFFLSTFSKY